MRRKSNEKELYESTTQIKIAIDFFESNKQTAARKSNAWSGDSEHWLMHYPKCLPAIK